MGHRDTVRVGLQKRLQKGFTLMEVIISFSLSVALLGLIVPFMVEIMEASLGVTNNMEIEISIRRITNELADEAREANSFLIYKTYFDDGHDIPGSFRDPFGDYIASDYRLRNSEHGNFCLFIYNGVDPTPSDGNPAPIERLIGYYLNPSSANSVGVSLQKFDVSIPEDFQYAPVEKLIPAQAFASDHEVIIDRANGLILGSLFFNIQERSVMVNGEIVHSVPSKQSSGTYNFTVSPRG